MLEDELRKEAKTKTSKARIVDTMHEILEQEASDNSVEKKQFLKRKTDTAKKSQTSTTKKNYKYYIDNFKAEGNQQESKMTEQTELNTDRNLDNFLIKTSSKCNLTGKKERVTFESDVKEHEAPSSSKKSQFNKMVS
jgi:hypothetical protein